MKQIFWTIAILLIWVGPANAGVLKVMIPIDEFEQMESRLKTLETENSRLQQGVASFTETPAEIDMGFHIDALEQENIQLKQQVESLSDKPSAMETGFHLEALDQENRQLKQQVESLAERSSAKATSSKEMDTRLGALGRENRRLKRSVASLKDAGAVLRSDKRSAKQVYFQTNKKLASHVFN